MGHQNCKSQMGSRQWWPFYISYSCVSRLSCRTVWRFRRCCLAGFVWSMWSRSTVLSWMCREASMWRRPSMWCVLSIMISTSISAAWCASVGASVMWPGATSLWVILTLTSVSVSAQMWSGSAKSVSVPVMMPRSGSSLVYHARMMFSVACRCAWWWYLDCTVCCYMTVFIAIETSYTGTMAWHVSWFLALKTFVIFTGHDIYHGWGQ